MTENLSNKTIVIVGAGPGFGRTLALQAAAQGATVVVAARTESRVVEIAEEVRAAGGSAIAAAVDATDPESVRALRETVEGHTDAVHGLVYSAFAVPSMKPLAQTDHDQISRGIDLSVLGALRTTQEFTPLLEAGAAPATGTAAGSAAAADSATGAAPASASVVMMASAVIHHSRERYAGYKIAKTALVALGHSLATELGPRGIRVNTVAPGYIYGETLKAYFEHLATKYGGTVDDVYAHTAEKMDLRRLPTEREIVDPVLFLLSDAASAVTGQTLTVDCGEFHT
ncbi:NAD(P)-dependent dehydrogenase, short-chain alcohol dehydrogenase family [Dietzia kunjamensis subsp. schimae]|uniref:NAD(P)-dependent dehydrogenase, short-chain alcohol dehydrogenase family n=1 Tax=Dietzia kunjamensis subsp. schimae TaxID=498198 RepID=A0ABY1MYX1_9ACTN|nr:SDR family oxidoreductase [Dietzia kunjamensis]SMO53591.1 NAD(P)-dependent dehydrogenase, short-chain alcohol dehydrogenase family [Dietzia kunjamensis subsp. schimae]